MNNYPEFSRLLNQHLYENKRSASWLAKELNLHSWTVSRWLNYDTRPGAGDVVLHIAEIFELGEAARDQLLKAADYSTRVQIVVAHRMKQMTEDRSNKDATDAPTDGEGAPTFSPNIRPVDMRRPLHRSNVPTSTTKLLGRESEFHQVCARLQEAHLLTILGPGGVGKTRLALEIAHACRPQFCDGVYFVSLAGVNSSAYLVSTLADGLQFTFYEQEDPKTQLLNYLRQKEVLLVLDNYEHLLPDTAVLTEMLAQAPAVKILVTSRQRLNLQAEWGFELQGLGFPADDTVHPSKEYGAVQLFEYTAYRVTAGFSLSDENRPYVTRICRFVSGFPLGIELAAVQCRVLSCQEIAQEIEKSMDNLTTSWQDWPKRHRSLYAVFEHTWQRLDEQERGVFRRLSVFRGGFGKEAAKEVAAASLEILTGLVDQSLLYRAASGRYEMHEVLWQYAAEKLAEKPAEEAEARDQHCSYYAIFLEDKDAYLSVQEERSTLEAVRSEIRNIRAAWGWALDQAKFDVLSRSRQGLASYYQLTGSFEEGERDFRTAVKRVQKIMVTVEQPEREGQILLGKLLAEQAYFLTERGILDRALTAAHEVIELGQATRTLSLEAAGYQCWGRILAIQLDYSSARVQLEKALSLSRTAQARRLEARCLGTLGVLSSEEADYDRGKSYYEQALSICQEMSYHIDGAGILFAFSRHLWFQADFTKARINLEQSLSIFRKLDYQAGEGKVLRDLGTIYVMQADFAGARTNLEQAQRIFQELGSRDAEVGFTELTTKRPPSPFILPSQAINSLASSCTLYLGIIDLLQGGYYTGLWGDITWWFQTVLQQDLNWARRTGHWLWEASFLLILGIIADYQGDHTDARDYLNKVLCICQKTGDGLITHRIAVSMYLGLVCHHLNENEAACEHSQKALNITQDIDSAPLESVAWTHLGHALAGLHHLAEATNAYQQALRWGWDEVPWDTSPTLRFEPLAGLAHIALVQDNLTQALVYVEEILQHRKTHALDKRLHPFEVYLTCYRVLRANHDDRAPSILKVAHRLLQVRADHISDAGMRRAFLKNVAAHREILEHNRNLRA